MQSKTFTLASILSVGLSGYALAQGETGTTNNKGAARGTNGAGKPVTIQMKDASGRAVGTAVMTRSSTGIAFKLNLKNLPPGEHAIMVHETGLCEGPDFQSAGGQLSGTSEPSGAGTSGTQGPDAGTSGAQGMGMPHGTTGVYDHPQVSLELEDITADPKGNVQATVTLPDASMYRSIVDTDGSALVVYSGADPHAATAVRIACGVIPGTSGAKSR